MNKIFYFLLLLLLPVTIMAQQVPQFSQYMFNTLYLNPAYAGMDDALKFSLLHRTQWAGYSATFDQGGSPSTQVFSVNAPVYNIHSGIGFHMVNDVVGPLTGIQAQLAYAYHIPVSSGKISLGVQGGVFSQQIDFSKYRWADPNDPLRRDGTQSQIKPDFALGLYYRGAKYFAGASLTHILSPTFDFGISGLNNPLSRVLYVNTGYDFQASPRVTITPSALIKSDFNVLSFELSAIANFQKKFYAGLSYRRSDAVIAIIGINLFNSLNLGYAFDYVVSGQSVKRPTSHEFLLSYSVPIGGPRQIIRTPRFSVR